MRKALATDVVLACDDLNTVLNPVKAIGVTEVVTGVMMREAPGFEEIVRTAEL